MIIEFLMIFTGLGIIFGLVLIKLLTELNDL